MKFYFKLLEKAKNQAGATAVIIAIVLPMLIGFTALAVDVGYMHVTKNELQNVADAAALAGAGYLGSKYETLSYDAQQNYVFSRSDIVADVQQVAGKNQAAGMKIVIINADVTIGTWNGDTETLTPMTAPTPIVGPDAVRVIARRDGSANGPILTFFARIFNIATVNVVADATAALTATTAVDEGKLKMPFGVSERMFDPPNCTDIINFSPTRGSCAGWHNFFDDINGEAMANKLQAFIVGDGVDESGNPTDDCLLSPCGERWLLYNFGHLLDPKVFDDDVNDVLENPGNYPDYFPDGATTPEASEGDYFEFQGGDINMLFNGWYIKTDDDVVANDTDIYATGYTYDDNESPPAPISAIATLFDYFRRRDDDGNDAVWTTTIPVYEEKNDPGEDCANPTGDLKIVGFAEIQVLAMNAKDDPENPREVSVKINCEKYFLPVRGGGGGVGFLRGTIPNLVE